MRLQYTGVVRDVVFFALVVAFFAVAVLLVRAGELVLGRGRQFDEDPRR